MAKPDLPDVSQLQTLVRKASYAVSMVRLTDYAKGLHAMNFFGPSTVLPNVISIEVTRSLDYFFAIGKIIIEDAASLREFLPITGNEVIAIKYKNQATKSGTGSSVSYFSIFSIEEINGPQKGRAGHKFLSITLIEFPAYSMLANSNGYRTFKGNKVKISDAADAILGGIPFINQYYNVQTSEKTRGEIPFWVPQTWTPIKAFTYLQKFAINDSNDPLYTLNSYQNSVANETASFKLPHLKFESVYSIAKRSNRTYITPKPYTPDSKNNQDYNPCDVILFKKGGFHDASALYSGLNGETYWGRDAIDGGSYFCKTYEEFLRTYKSFGFWSTFPSSQRNGWGNQWSNVNLTHISSRYKSQIEGKMSNDYANRLMKSAARLDAVCYLNEFRDIGETANLNISNGDAERSGLDLMMGGPWLTWAVTDRIAANGEAFSDVTYIRDSFYMVDNVAGYLPKMNPINNLKLNL